MKFKNGDTVYVKGKVVECIQSDFEIGFGYHSEEYIVKLNDDVRSDVIVNCSILFSKDEIKNDKLVPEIGKQYVFIKNPDMRPLTVVHITESSIFYEYGQGTRGFVMEPASFIKMCVPV